MHLNAPTFVPSPRTVVLTPKSINARKLARSFPREPGLSVLVDKVNVHTPTDDREKVGTEEKGAKEGGKNVSTRRITVPPEIHWK